MWAIKKKRKHDSQKKVKKTNGKNCAASPDTPQVSVLSVARYKPETHRPAEMPDQLFGALASTSPGGLPFIHQPRGCLRADFLCWCHHPPMCWFFAHMHVRKLGGKLIAVFWILARWWWTARCQKQQQWHWRWQLEEITCHRFAEILCAFFENFS